jgi:hypothetical protein
MDIFVASIRPATIFPVFLVSNQSKKFFWFKVKRNGAKCEKKICLALGNKKVRMCEDIDEWEQKQNKNFVRKILFKISKIQH